MSAMDKVLEIQIHPGWKSGTKIRFPRAGNEQPNGEAQDLVFVVEEKPHDRFKRKDNHLFTKVEVDLLTALAGGQFAIKHLDDRALIVNIHPGEVLQHSTCSLPMIGSVQYS